MKGLTMVFWYLSVTVGSLWVLLVDATVRKEVVISRVAETGLTESSFLMFLFAAKAWMGGRPVLSDAASKLVAAPHSFSFKLYRSRESERYGHGAFRRPPYVLVGNKLALGPLCGPTHSLNIRVQCPICFSPAFIAHSKLSFLLNFSHGHIVQIYLRIYGQHRPPAQVKNPTL